MAGDWIKMRTDLYRDPKVCLIADALMSRDGQLAGYVNQHCQRDMTVTRNVTRCATVGALVTVWGVTRVTGRRNGDDLLVPGATLSVIDDISELPGFGMAMASVNWAIQTDAGVVLPRFFGEFNVDPTEKKKASAAERQRRYRAKKSATSDVTRDVTVAQQSDIEKRREEYICNTHTPAAEKRGRRHLAESFPVADSGILCVEIDGQLVSYDDDSLRWEAEFIRQWNAAKGNSKFSGNALSEAHRGLLRARLSDPGWHWRQALAKFPLWSETGWTPGLMWFLESGSVQNILEGRHDHRKPKPKGKSDGKRIGPDNTGSTFNRETDEQIPTIGLV